MGRGRQKAKHTKVARDLKYFSPDTNYGALEKELTGTGDPRLAEDLEKWPEFAGTGDVTSATDEYAEDEFDSEEQDEKSA
jgi:predicted translin family RNA/ssDNA-binding protein